MILTLEEAQAIYNDNPNAGRIGKMRKEAQHIEMHMTGERLNKYLAKIERFENDAQATLRAKLAKSSKAQFTRILRPVDKIFTAPGGGIFYDMTENNVRRFRELEDEGALRKWMRQTWQPIAIADPNGVVFCEVTPDERVEQVTYSIENIYEYKQDSTGAYEFIMFEPQEREEDKEHKYLRVVDDVADTIYRVDEEGNLFIVQDETFPNYFGFVPAVQNSSKHKLKDPHFKVSQIDSIIEIADEALVDSSIKAIYKKLHGFPRYWEYAQPCLTCSGTGLVEGKPCPSCNGSGYKEKSDVSDVLRLNMPSTNKVADEEVHSVPKIAPDIAGYVAPDLDTWKQMNEEAQMMEQKMFKTLWGTQNIESTSSNETATGRFIDVQPVSDRLNDFREEAERVEAFTLKCKAVYYFGDSFKGVSDNYGHRYLVESPDALMDKYNKARTAGAPDSILNALLEQVYYTEFQSNGLMLQRQLKLMRVEPFIHKNLADLPAGSAERNKKIHFNEWLNQVPAIDLTLKPATALTQMFNKYLQDNGLLQISGVQRGEEE